MSFLKEMTGRFTVQSNLVSTDTQSDSDHAWKVSVLTGCTY